MSSTRRLNKKLTNTAFVDIVQPTKALFITSMPCEIQAAYICNKASKAIADDNLPKVIERYNQSVRGQWNNQYEILFAACAIPFLIMTSLQLKQLIQGNEDSDINQKSNALFYLLVAVICYTTYAALHIAPALSNTIRYSETKNLCRDWLKNHLDEKEIDKIANLPNKKSVNDYIAEMKH